MNPKTLDRALMTALRNYKSGMLTKMGFERQVSNLYAQRYSGAALCIAIDTFINKYAGERSTAA